MLAQHLLDEGGADAEGGGDLLDGRVAALVSPASGRYLVQVRTLPLSPGASVFVVESETARRKERGGVGTALAVGDPAFDRHRFASLQPLPSAGVEAKEVAALYGSRPLLGSDAR